MDSDVLGLHASMKTAIIGFMDYLAVVVIVKQSKDKEVYVNETVSARKVWLGMVRLDLAA